MDATTEPWGAAVLHWLMGEQAAALHALLPPPDREMPPISAGAVFSAVQALEMVLFVLTDPGMPAALRKGSDTYLWALDRYCVGVM